MSACKPKAFTMKNYRKPKEMATKTLNRCCYSANHATLHEQLAALPVPFQHSDQSPRRKARNANVYVLFRSLLSRWGARRVFIFTPVMDTCKENHHAIPTHPTSQSNMPAVAIKVVLLF